MSTKFFDASKVIADGFLQSIVFIDDEAYNKNQDGSNLYDLSPSEITKVFAKAHKICSVLNPVHESELFNLIKIGKKSDVVVLDWRMNLEPESNSIINEEDDAEIDDTRGPYTISIIKGILTESFKVVPSLKLIIIYTGETNLREINERIFNELASVPALQKGNFDISSQSFRIAVIGKSSLKNQVKHNRDIKERIKDYHEIPNFILDEFTKLTSGLVSNVALKSITSLRENTSKILHFFNKQLDPAFLTHRALLRIPDDAGELLKESILNSFKAIIDYERIEEMCSIKPINNWIDSNTFTGTTLKVLGKHLKINQKELKLWQKKGYVASMEGILHSQFPREVVEIEKIEKEYKSAKGDEVINHFTPSNEVPTSLNEKFSILTNHKSNYLEPTYLPRLTLGTVIMGSISGDYLISIQQKCDSTRIDVRESRRFLFLPLQIVSGNGHFNFLVKQNDTYVKLKVNFDTYGLKTIKFNATKDQMVVAKKGRNAKYLFYPIYYKANKKSKKGIDQSYEWIMDLKDGHSQKVANDYAAKLSRVAIDESEWLRRLNN